MNWAHLHLALNHIPVLGTLFVGILLVTACLKRSEELMRLSLAWFVALTIISLPIKFTGDFAYQAVGDSPWLLPAGINAHEQAADQATTGIFLLGLVAATGLFQARGGRSIPAWTIPVTAVLALATFVLMARTANLGGQLRHEEIRPSGSRPATQTMVATTAVTPGVLGKLTRDAGITRSGGKPDPAERRLYLSSHSPPRKTPTKNSN